MKLKLGFPRQVKIKKIRQDVMFTGPASKLDES
jgi:hypothetical protein